MGWHDRTSCTAPVRTSTGRHAKGAQQEPFGWNRGDPAHRPATPRDAIGYNTHTHSPTQPPTHSPAQPPTHSPTEDGHPPARPHARPPAHPLTDPSTHQKTQQPTNPRARPSTHPPSDPPTHSPTAHTPPTIQHPPTSHPTKPPPATRHPPPPPPPSHPCTNPPTLCRPPTQPRSQPPSTALSAHFHHRRSSAQALQHSCSYVQKRAQARNGPCLASAGLATTSAAKGSALNVGLLTSRSRLPQHSAPCLPSRRCHVSSHLPATTALPSRPGASGALPRGPCY